VVTFLQLLYLIFVYLIGWLMLVARGAASKDLKIKLPRLVNRPRAGSRVAVTTVDVVTMSRRCAGLGIDQAVELCHGGPGIHFITFNKST
jgi:hypothetical protein